MNNGLSTVQGSVFAVLISYAQLEWGAWSFSHSVAGSRSPLPALPEPPLPSGALVWKTGHQTPQTACCAGEEEEELGLFTGTGLVCRTGRSTEPDPRGPPTVGGERCQSFAGVGLE